jgi:A118 family predicted phage portal protein
MSIIDVLRRGFRRVSEIVNVEQNSFVSEEYVKMYEYMQLWNAYYQNDPSVLSVCANNDEVYKNSTVTYPAMYRVCDKVAKLIFTELPKFTFDDKSAARMEYIITKNKLFERLREGQAEVCGLGNVFLKINVDEELDYPVIELVRGLDVAPSRVKWGVILEPTFYTLKKKDGKASWWLAQTYKTIDEKKVIESKLYKGDSVNLGVEKELTTIPETEKIKPIIDLGTENPWWVHVKSPMPNNKDPRSPLGMSIAANGLEQIDHINLTMQSYYKDDKLKQPKAAVTEDLVQTKVRGGKIEHIVDFDEDFYIVLNADKDGSSLYKVIDMKSKQKDFEESIQGKLDRFYETCGLFRAAVKKESGGAKTATEWELADKDSIDTSADFKNSWLVALYTLFHAILEIDNKHYQGPKVTSKIKHDLKQNIVIEFMDGVKNDRTERANRALLEKNSGLIDDVQYFIDTRNMDKDEAQEFVNEMNARKPQETTDEFVPGSDA